MHTHEPSAAGSQLPASATKANSPAAHPSEVMYPGQQPASSPTNPFPPRPHEVYRGEPALPSRTIVPQPIAASPTSETSPEPDTLEKPESLQFRFYSEGQAPPDPPRWHGIQAKLTVGAPHDPDASPTVQRQEAASGRLATSRLEAPTIQRDPTPAQEITTANFNPSQLKVGAWTPQIEGNVEASPVGDKVEIKAPKVTFKTTVGLKIGWKMAAGTRIDAGPVQSLVSSERVGVYRKGGPAGEVVVEQKMTHAASRDATGGIDMKANDVDYAPPPWYSRPNPLNDSMSEAEVVLVDRPKFKAMPKQMQGGVLTEIRGQDRFIASVGVKAEGQSVAFLKSYQWSVPWDLKIDNAIGTGGTVTGSETDQSPSAITGDPTNTIPSTEWQSFPTIAAAMGASPAVLMSNLAIAKANDPTSWKNSIEALRRKNPIFRVNITANKLAGLFSDQITVQATGSKTDKMESLELNTEVRSCTATFALKDVFDLESIGASSQLKIEVLPLGSSTVWSYPFAAQATPAPLKGGKGEYTVTGDFL